MEQEKTGTSPPAKPAGVWGVLIFALLGLAAVGIYGYLTYARLTGSTAVLSSPRLPDPHTARALGRADPEWRFRGMDGAERSFGELRGRAVFVNVWATWCAPCREEMPAIERLYRSLEGEPVEFVVVSEEDEETVRRFLERQAYSFPVYVSTGLPEALGSRGIPATFIVDPAGAVVFMHVGAADWNKDSVRSFLRALAARPADGT